MWFSLFLKEVVPLAGRQLHSNSDGRRLREASKIGPQRNSVLNPKVRRFGDNWPERENSGPKRATRSAEVIAKKSMNVALFIGLVGRRRTSHPLRLAERV